MPNIIKKNNNELIPQEAKIQFLGVNVTAADNIFLNILTILNNLKSQDGNTKKHNTKFFCWKYPDTNLCKFDKQHAKCT